VKFRLPGSPATANIRTALLAALVVLGLEAVATATTIVDSNGKLVVDGRPVFLHGMYHDSMDATPIRYGADFRGDVRTISAAGFNTVWVSIDPTWDAVAAESFAFLSSAGVHVISNFYLANPEPALSPFSGMRPLIGLSVGDDFNFPANRPRYRPEQLASNRRLVARRLPGVLAIASGGAHPILPVAPYATAMDVMALQCYPIGNTDQNVPGGEPYELEMCDDMLTSARAELGYDYPLLPTLQAFEWPHAGARYPTARELRNMFYTTLQFAPAGILWYSYYDGRRPLSAARPDLWEELSRVAADAARLEAAFLRGQFSKIENPEDPFMAGTDGAWHGAYWTLEDHAYLIVTNTDTETSKHVDFALPGYRTLAPLIDDERYADTLRYESGRVRGTAEPYSVHVYSLSAAP
jgi:hypothetical protein